MGKIKVAVVGVGNCASSLIQGLEHYRQNGKEKDLLGIMNRNLGGYFPEDIDVVAAFDIDRRKVGKPLEQAVFAPPNCTRVFQSTLPVSGVEVQMGPVLDGVAPHMDEYPDEKAFRVADREPVDLAKALREARARTSRAASSAMTKI